MVYSEHFMTAKVWRYRGGL